jgi:hypothetical protein
MSFEIQKAWITSNPETLSHFPMKLFPVWQVLWPSLHVGAISTRVSSGGILNILSQA